MSRIVPIIVLALLTQYAQAGDNWPQFGGPTGNGKSDSVGLPLTWSETENVVWKTSIHDLGWSSPVIWGDQIWMTTATRPGLADHRLRTKNGGLIPRAQTTPKSFYAVCVDRDTGAVTHDVKVFDVAAPDIIAPQNSYASPTPVIEEGRLYVHFGTNGTACVDTQTGKVQWTRSDINGDHEMGPGASPILHGEFLIFTHDCCDVQYIIALDKGTGETVWKTDRTVDLSNYSYGRRKSYGTPTIYKAADRLEMVTAAALGLYAHDPQTGKELWKMKLRGQGAVPRPVFYDGLLYAVLDHEFPEISAIKPGGNGWLDDSDTVWNIRKSAPRTPSFLLVDGRVLWVTDDGIAVCVDAKSGEMVWRKRLGGKFSSSTIYADGRAYFSNHDTTATVIEPGGEYKELAKNQLDGQMRASPAVAGKSLFVRTETHLYRIEDSDSAK